MSFEMPMIVLLLAANALWYLVGWAKGFNEGCNKSNYPYFKGEADTFSTELFIRFYA